MCDNFTDFQSKRFFAFFKPLSDLLFLCKAGSQCARLFFFVSALAGGEGASERIAEPTLASEKR